MTTKPFHHRMSVDSQYSLLAAGESRGLFSEPPITDVFVKEASGEQAAPQSKQPSKGRDLLGGVHWTAFLRQEDRNSNNEHLRTP